MGDDEIDKHSSLMDGILGWAMEGKLTDTHVTERVQEFLHMTHGDQERAVSAAINAFLLTGTTTGFASGVGGLMYSAVALPTDLVYQIYLGVRLCLIIAGIYGLKLTDFYVTSMAKACALGCEAVTAVGKCIGEACAKGAAKKLLRAGLGPTVTSINRAIGYRFMTIGASKTGAVSLVKLVPIIGGIVGGGFNYAALQAVGSRARAQFREFQTDEYDSDDDNK